MHWKGEGESVVKDIIEVNNLLDFLIYNIHLYLFYYC